MAFILTLPVLLAHSQNKTTLDKLSFLVESDWLTIGTWNDGTPFKQKSSAEWGLNGTIIKINQTGIINLETGERGVRNEAIITLNKIEEKLQLYVFDVYGSIIETDIIFDSDKIYFEYVCNDGKTIMKLRDTLEKIDDDSYNFILAATENDTWNHILLTGKMQSVMD